ncbi:hypothetical protein [Crateriforma conspicua]|uniref:Acyltransferase PapA5 n=1 Tax=Crateriforma conspicua TaxID=2527996 RepID=A0A5C6FX09_9PLAN|nr:hypothetical protein [Crateriforma conspicua]TWU67439.1 acyltransferase PapA5 [Crateriforma conspicua]
MSKVPADPASAIGSESESSLPRHGDTFPLRLTAFEQLLVFDDDPACPMTSFIELHFATPLQVMILHDAFGQTVHRHPLLASTLVEKDGRLYWDYDPGFVPTLHDPADFPILQAPVQSGVPAGKEAAGSPQPSPRPIDLWKHPGCRYWYDVNPKTDKSRLTIQLHHAVCDGVGLRRVLIDVLAAYAKATDNRADSSDENASQSTRRRVRRGEQLDVSRLCDRADYSSILSREPKIQLTTWDRIKNAYYFHCQRPRPLKGSAASRPEKHTGEVSESQATSDQPLRHHIFSESVSQRLVDCCRRHEVGMNDLMLTVLFRVCRLWNRRHGADRSKTRIRLLMPVDLRSRADLNMPATNRLSFAFLGRTHGQCEDWHDLLCSVQSETQFIKDSRVHMDFVGGLDGFADHPNRLRRAIRYSGNMTTSVLTYTGDISRGMKSHFPEVGGRRRIGDSYLENILIAPPARRNTNITLGVCINWGQVCVSANWNRGEFTQQDTADFLRMFADTTLEWLTRMETESITDCQAEAVV